MNRLVMGILGVAGLLTPLSVAQAQQAGPAVTQVGVIEMHRQDVAKQIDMPGRAVAFEQVAIRPRVGGVVTSIDYQPGQHVSAGDALFHLDDASYTANVAAAQAAFAQAQADLPVKQAAFDRISKLVDRGYTQADLESAQSELASANATLESTRAALEYAKIELSWTSIRSPIDGVPEVQDVSVGDLVSAAQSDAMTTVTRLDPIYVDMLQPSANLLQIQRRIEDGSLTPNENIDATLILEDGQAYAVKGKIVSPSAIVSPTTGTVRLRFQFENPDRKILPGMFVRGSMTLGTVNAFLVPQRATTIAPTGKVTAFVVRDGKSQIVDLTYTGVHENQWVVTDGINEGDSLIVDGLRNMTSGRTVEPVAVTVDAEGLTQTTAKAQ